ncbi:hypothetical protein FRACYDRAFT_242374 [Fragilariopsis cylindrus CCMP1102]|uniref:Uncharacterized protein n=1 Tax=Fragilariopsis cylindrus CCMP1102 TaxID=635003 RepID=A0A1E7F773_9STRA|nr:hypothetical protein FRACYDRAFT_242374 [Fragilariopsis cylindrus CCMP1102]|eukprot:OEU14021.1 hypothetical protein FRACYDRAFT_242374 [Fragilariopsis cylindrus CCMP1102]
MISVKAASRQRMTMLSSRLQRSCLLGKSSRSHQQQQQQQHRLSSSLYNINAVGGRISKSSTNTNRRSLSSSSSSPAPPSSKPLSAGEQHRIIWFHLYPFWYSMNAVGRGDVLTGGSSGSGENGEEEDPLAQLKAEAQEALDHRNKVESEGGGSGSGGRMTPDEIRALESGAVLGADMTALEEEANRNILGLNTSKDGEKKKKPWYRFGF